ncbi:class I SAM-dependent methyltransferase [Epilithonimonas sp.]|uniref:class I SAM-dependent methyltransferase n=1 Tax=Epilithonimonas sp. TaxID=2894511 RepID=UPI00289D4908|nr:class I SAM-dependent methyltransferase [Epilithonimonas sp.]
MSTIESIKSKFNAVSEKYDKQRKELIPCFDDFYKIPVELSNQIKIVDSILDIGAGTGLMSAFFLEKYNEADFTLVDISEEMLKKAKERFSGFSNFEFLIQDLEDLALEKNKFDLVISGLAIHHLDDEAKKQLFKTIYNLLKDGGLFINADQVLGENDFSETLYTSSWREKVTANKTLTSEEKEATFERIKLDKMSPLKEQLKWLEDVGFKNVANLYQYYNFVVYNAKK